MGERRDIALNRWNGIVFVPVLLGMVTMQVLLIVGTIREGTIVPALVAAVVLLLLSFYRALLGICAIILLQYFTLASTEQVTGAEILWTLLFFSVVAGWLIRKVVFRQERIVRTVPETGIVVFLLLCLTSVLLAAAQNTSLTSWFRKLFPLLGYLLYFPIVDTIKGSRQLKLMVVCFLLLGLSIGIRNFVFFKNVAASIRYAFQVGGARQNFCEPFFLTIFVVAYSISLYVKSKLQRISYTALAILSFIILIFTLSRGYWIASVVCIAALFILLPLRKKMSLVLHFALIGSVMIVFIDVVLGAPAVWGIVERILSIGQVGRDVAMQERFYETKAVLALIKANPFTGYGLGATYSYRSLVHHAMPVWYIHNAYLYLMFTLGTVGLVAYLVFYIGMLRRGLALLRRRLNRFQRGLVQGIACVFIGMLAVSITSPQFAQKTSILVIVLGSAIIEILWRAKSGSCAENS